MSDDKDAALSEDEPEHSAGAQPAAPAIELPPIPSELREVIHPLRQCPNCDYSLAGLPVIHRCPECGEWYDDSMLELRGSGKPTLHHVVMVAIVVGVVVLAVVWLRSPIITVFGLFFAVPLLVAAVWEFQRAQRRMRCIVLPQGFRVGHSGHRTSYPWRRLAEARADSGFFGWALIVGTSLAGPITLRRYRVRLQANRKQASAVATWLLSCRAHVADAALRDEVVHRVEEP